MLKTDLHIHTNYVIKRFDSTLSPKQVIDLAASKNFDVLAITEHAAWHIRFGLKYFKNPLKPYYLVKDYAKKKGILLLPGVETLIEGKETLLVNFKGDPRKYTRFSDLEKLRGENVLVVAPHPFYGRPSCLKNKIIEYVDLFDAFEHCFFYNKFINPNKKTLEIAKRFNKPVIANSDLHHSSYFATNFTWVDAEKNVDSVLEAIRKNRVKIDTRPLTFREFSLTAFWSLSTTLIKHLMYKSL